MHLVDVSTYLQDGRILVKALRRYMIFSHTGQFVDEVEFEPIKNKQEMAEILETIRQNTQNRIKASKKVAQYDDEGNEIKQEVKKQDKKKSAVPIGLNNMRDLLQFS